MHDISTESYRNEKQRLGLNFNSSSALASKNTLMAASWSLNDTTVSLNNMSRDEIRLFIAGCNHSEATTLRLRGTLTAFESKRIKKYQSPADRSRYLTGRGALRMLLGDFLGCDPEQVDIRIDKSGKPELADSAGERMRFNISHSGDYVLLGFCKSQSIGVDIEQVTDARHYLPIAKQILAAEQFAEWRTLPDADRNRIFFDRWVRLEAFGKATGIGLNDLTPTVGEPTGHLQNVSVPNSYAAAVATCEDSRLR